MAVASFAGRPFRVDPTSISWDFTVKTSAQVMVGGKVVQVYGTKVSDLTLEGSFGVGGWQQQLKFLIEMKAIADEQVNEGLKPRSTHGPHLFIYPPRDWNLLVYLKAYTSPDGPRALVHSEANFNPRWSLTLFIVEDNSGLKKVAQDAYIARVAKGIGWRQTEFNGPLGAEVVQDTLTTSRANRPQ